MWQWLKGQFLGWWHRDEQTLMCNFAEVTFARLAGDRGVDWVQPPGFGSRPHMERED